MKISALVFDLDGTAIPNRPDGMPSQKVIEVIKKAQSKVSVSIATGRRTVSSVHIFDALGITAPSIVSGGTQVYDPKRKKILWEKSISQKTVRKVINLAKPYSFEVYVSDNPKTMPASEIEVTKNERLIYLMRVSAKDVPIILEDLSKLTEVVTHQPGSYVDGHFDIHVTHKHATKKTAMHELLNILKVPENEVMVVGDGNNDLPLFEAAGLRVAMGNAGERLKEQADYITLDVSEDGLAHAIEKYLL